MFWRLLNYQQPFQWIFFMHDAFAIALNGISLWILYLLYFSHWQPFSLMQHVFDLFPLTSSFSALKASREQMLENITAGLVSVTRSLSQIPSLLRWKVSKPSTQWHKPLVMHFRHLMFCHNLLKSRPADLHHTAEWREHHEKHFLHTDL